MFGFNAAGWNATKWNAAKARLYESRYEKSNGKVQSVYFVRLKLKVNYHKCN